MVELTGKKSKSAPKERRSKDALALQFEFIEKMTQHYLKVLDTAVDSGKANTTEGLLGLLGVVDTMHGGAYAVPVNQRPYFLPNPEASKYYAGALANLNQGQGLAGFFSSAFGGQNAGELFRQIMMDSNVPHVLPKILSDEAYAQFMVTYAYLVTTDLFKQAGTGLKTYVDASTELIGAVRGGSTKAQNTTAEAALLKANLGLAADANGATA